MIWKIKWVVAVMLVLALTSSVFGAVTLLNQVGKTPSHWMGLYADARPVGINYGSTYYAEDVGVLYMYGSSGWVVDNRNIGEAK